MGKPRYIHKLSLLTAVPDYAYKDHEYHPQILPAVNSEFAADGLLLIAKPLLTASCQQRNCC